MSSTLVIGGLDYKEHTPMVIRNYFQQMHPHVSIRWLKQHTINLHLGYILTRTITWAKDTRRLRRLLWRLDFAQVGADQLWS